MKKDDMYWLFAILILILTLGGLLYYINFEFNKSLERRVLELNSEVSEASVKDIIKALDKAEAGEKITLKIYSSGGDMFAGYALNTALINTKADVTVEVDAWAASAAADPICLAKHVKISPFALVVFHIASNNGTKVNLLPDTLDHAILQSNMYIFRTYCHKILSDSDLQRIEGGEDFTILGVDINNRLNGG